MGEQSTSGDAEREKGLETTDKLAKYIPQAVLNFLRGKQTIRPSTNLAFVDKKGGTLQLDFDIPMEVIRKNMPSFVKKELKQLSTDVATICTPRSFDDPGKFYKPEHSEAFIHYQFKTEADMDKWQSGSDSDWSEGYSKCDFYRSDRGTAIFEGTLNKRLVKDGRTKRAGWCSIRSIRDTGAFGRKKHYWQWEGFSHLLIKCRGDGRSYKVMLHTPEHFDISWADSHSHQLHTHGGPYWQYELIPFSRFFHTMQGRIMDRQHRVSTNRTSSIGFVLMDRIDGPFRLEIAFVGVYNDRNHREQFAYEKYNSPLYHPDM